jgi:hypothetical protein
VTAATRRRGWAAGLLLALALGIGCAKKAESPPPAGAGVQALRAGAAGGEVGQKTPARRKIIVSSHLSLEVGRLEAAFDT